MSIAILPARLANQIAAGEVVERPASVVKELVENSLDAGATHIHIDVERGGHKLIRITDNGAGIDKDELTLALSRHATSKLKTLDDLENICSLGFRGEALASISSVSRLTLKSKPAHQEQAWQAFAEGRDMAVQIQPTAHPDGTSIEVKDLFFNTPARRKFLRTEKTEFNHIDELVKRIALSRFDISLTLTHNTKVVRQYRRVNNDDTGALKRVSQVAGKAFGEHSLHLQSGEAGLFVQGWMMPQGAQSEPQYTYVNGRMMRDKLILHAIRQAYEECNAHLGVPAFVLYVQIDPRQVDVNVHPAKHEVRFHQARLVHDFILQAVKQVIAAQQPLHEQPSAEPESTHATPMFGEPDYPKSSLQPTPNYSAPSGGQGAASSSGSRYSGGATRSSAHYGGDNTQKIASVNQFYQGISESQAQHFSAPVESTSNALVSTLQSTHILSLKQGQCALNIDGELHLAHWRDVLALAWEAQLQNSDELHQRALLLPVRVAINEQESERLERVQSWLSVLGFDLQLHKQYAMVKKVPQSLYSLDAKQLVERILELPQQAQDNLQSWLQWMQKHTPAAYFDTDAFTLWQSKLQKSPEIAQQLQQKAVKIDLTSFIS